LQLFGAENFRESHDTLISPYMDPFHLSV